MQEPETNNVQETEANGAQEPQERKKPSMFAIGVTAVIAIVVLAGIIISYSIFNTSYNTNLDKLTALVTQADAQFARGDDAAGATPEDQYKYYTAIDGQIDNLSGILKKLNDKYPLLLGKANDESTGLAGLSAKMDELSPKLATLKACIDEDASVAAKLTGLLGGGAQTGLSGEYTALISRNNALKSNLAGLSFFSALEDGRKAMLAAVDKRSSTLAFLEGDAAVNEQLAALLADTAAVPSDNVTTLNGLLQKNDELAAKVSDANLAGGDNVAQMLNDRKGQINANIAYYTELVPLWSSAQAFSAQMDSNAAQGGKFSARVASYMSSVKQLQELEKQLKTIGDKPEYAVIANKRTLSGIGLSPEGQALAGYLKALVAVDAAVTSSNAMEKDITALLGNKTMTMVTKISSLTALLNKNEKLVASLAVEVPADLAEGLSSFTEGCKERTNFLNCYMNFTQNSGEASSLNATYKGYLSQRSASLAEANKFPAGSADRDFYNNMAADQLTLANDTKTRYNDTVKLAAADKKAYEVSRKKYVPMLDK